LGKFATDVTSTTSFTLQTLDGGSDPQSARDAGIEAVSPMFNISYWLDLIQA
jgi:hypothetical protein